MSWSEGCLPFSFFLFLRIGVFKNDNWMIEDVVPGFNHYKYIAVVAKRSHHWVVFIDTKCSTQILSKNSSVWSPYFFRVWFQTQQQAFWPNFWANGISYFGLHLLLGFGSNTIMGVQIFDLTFEQGNYFSLVFVSISFLGFGSNTMGLSSTTITTSTLMLV